MEKKLTIVNDYKEISFSDLDDENDMRIEMKGDHVMTEFTYLDEENIISLQKHLTYLVGKINSNEVPEMES